MQSNDSNFTPPLYPTQKTNSSVSLDDADQFLFGRRIFKNTVWNIFGRFTPMIAQFFLTPYITHIIGNRLFGIWTFAFIVANYAAFLDFGFSAGLTKFVAEDHAKKDQASLSSAVNTGILFYSLLSLVLIIIIWQLAKPLAIFMKFNLELRDAIFAIRGAAIVLLFLNLLDIGFSILNGIQRMDSTNLLRCIQVLLTVAGTIIVLEQGFSLRGLIVNYIIVSVLSVIMIFATIVYLIPSYKFSFHSISRRAFKRLGFYGINMQISTIAGTVVNNFDTILAGYFKSPIHMTFYRIGSQLTQVIRPKIIPKNILKIMAVSE